MTIKIRKGYNLPIAGAVESAQPARSVPARVVAISPDDYPGFEPKADVQPGDVVERGGILLHSKRFPSVALVSPASGTVRAVVRGERRKILRVEVEAGNGAARRFARPARGNVAGLRHLLATSGILAMMRQRPYDIVPRVDIRPRDIFVTAFDSAPLAPSLERMVADRAEDIECGVRALAKLTDGHIYISTRKDSQIAVPTEAVHYIVNGPHPAGNAGVQAANIAPVNKGEVIWTLDIVTLARVGKLVRTGEADWDVNVAVTGSEVETGYIAATQAGAAIAPILSGNVKADGRHHRIIAGNVLTGVAVDPEGYLHYPYRQITVIPEGDDADEFMGWASMRPGKMSVNRSFPSRFIPGKRFAPDARLLGGRRAMIMSGVYDDMFPMDILPEYLLKAILSKDIDKMEALGIYEVAPEDFALCEYADPSKIEIQKAVRDGLDYLRKELE